MMGRTIVLAMALSLASSLGLGQTALADHAWWTKPGSGSILDERPKGDRWMGRVKWDEGYIEVMALGAADPAMAANLAHAEVLALKTARYRAYEKLLEIVRGVRLSAYTQLERELLADGVLMARVRGMVRGARIISQKVSKAEDGSIMAEVRLGLLLGGPGGLSSAALAAMRKKAHKPATLFKPKQPPPPVKAAKPYSGLIVLAEGLGTKPAMFPRIVEAKSGREIYGPDRVDKTAAMAKGVVGYAVSLKRAKQNQRVGDNPLVIKAVKAQGNNMADLVVSYDDAVRLFAADVKSGFLAQCKVVIVIK